jgi:uncharacterized protein YqjF (DUF2071 family)
MRIMDEERLRRGPRLRDRLVGATVAEQRWNDVLFVHYECAAASLESKLPRPLTLDTYEGRAFVTVVAVQIKESRLLFLPRLPGVSDFEEINLRTYVQGPGGAGTEPVGAGRGPSFFASRSSNSAVRRLDSRMKSNPV